MLNQQFTVSKEIVQEVKQVMDKEKYAFIPNAYTKEFCASVCQQMDNFSSGLGIEFNYNDSEMRAWSAQKRSSEIMSFCQTSDELISAINGEEKKAGTILAIRNRALKSEDQVSLKGRWHIDSWCSQEKVFLFLTDTTIESGPFEFIPGTNAPLFRFIKALEPGFFFDIKTLLKRGAARPYQSIDDKKISSLFDKGFKPKQAIVKAGTLLVADTSYLIHRARPCISGERYALTAYYSVKEGFNDFAV